MNYNKIGTFIANERKAKNLTQTKLAELLFVSDKTISKWENGHGIPDTSSLPKLCEIFDVSLNELLNGERIVSDNYKTKAEEQLLKLESEKQESDKRLLKTEIVLGLMSTIQFLFTIIISPLIIEHYETYTLPIIAIALSTILFIVGVAFCLRIEQIVGYYVCNNCKHKHVPSYSKTVFAPHICRTRYMECPNCGKKSWHKKVLK